MQIDDASLSHCHGTLSALMIAESWAAMSVNVSYTCGDFKNGLNLKSIKR